MGNGITNLRRWEVEEKGGNYATVRNILQTKKKAKSGSQQIQGVDRD